MILFGGIPSEPPLRWAIEAADAAGVDHVVLNQRRAEHAELTMRVRHGQVTGCLSIDGRRLPLDAFTGVYLRLMDPCHLPESQATRYGSPEPERVEVSRLLNEALLAWSEVAACRVFNRASASASNGSKPYQAQIITACGFATPPTLITNDPREVEAFIARHGRVVYKSISSVRSIVAELGSGDRGQLARVRSLPTQFQAFVPGTNIRVHVVDDRVFATEVDTSAVDYRYAAEERTPVSMRATRLPAAVADRCRTLSQRLQLPLCGIDLKRTPSGQFFCFEVNPSPAYSCFGPQGRAIARAIVRALASGGRSQPMRERPARSKPVHGAGGQRLEA
jgi:hypothetical protein